MLFIQSAIFLKITLQRTHIVCTNQINSKMSFLASSFQCNFTRPSGSHGPGKAPFIVKLLHHTVAFSQLIQACYSICLFHVGLSLSIHTILSAVLLFSFDKQPTFCEVLQVQFAWFTGLLFFYNSATHREPLILRKKQFTTACTAYCGIKY